MSRARSFWDDASPPPTPAGVEGKIRRSELQIYLSFPGRDPITYRPAGLGNGFKASLEGKEIVFASVFGPSGDGVQLVGLDHPDFALRADGRLRIHGIEGQLKANGPRIEAWAGTSLIWTLREAWKDSDYEKGTRAFVTVPTSELNRSHLDWWLFAAHFWFGTQWSFGIRQISDDLLWSSG